MTPDERRSEVCDLSNSVFNRMHEGAMWQLELTDLGAGWSEVRRRLNRLDFAHERGIYTTHKPA
jgi:hypothetical protein